MSRSRKQQQEQQQEQQRRELRVSGGGDNQGRQHPRGFSSGAEGTVGLGCAEREIR